MKRLSATIDPIETLIGSRKVADFASKEGISSISYQPRSCYTHLGAALADSILQAGLNYETVVRPRINHILTYYPYATSINNIADIVYHGKSSIFLNWTHHEKIARFDRLVLSMKDLGISNINDLRENLYEDSFCHQLQNLHGIGPKTVDYMSCLVGIESIAVDRHIRTFAKRAGVEDTDYYYLKKVFCFAADLLSISRRGFDAWVWKKEAKQKTNQLSLAV